MRCIFLSLLALGSPLLNAAHELHAPFLGVHHVQIVFYPRRNDTFVAGCSNAFDNYARFLIKEQQGERFIFFFPITSTGKRCRDKLFTTDFFVRYYMEDDMMTGLEPVDQVFYCESLYETPDWALPLFRRIFAGNARNEFADIQPANEMDLAHLGVMPPLRVRPAARRPASRQSDYPTRRRGSPPEYDRLRADERAGW